MKINVTNIETPELTAKFVKTIDIQRSRPYNLRTCLFSSEWLRSTIKLPNQTWLDRQTMHYEEPLENE